MGYKPRPIDTSKVALPASVHDLTEHLARHNHDVWARGRLAEGWTWGPTRDDAARTHPDLVPYEELPESEKEYDRHTTLEALKAILACGYHIEAPETAAAPARESAAEAERLLRAGDPLAAYDIASEALGRWPGDVRLRQLQALALARCGATLRAKEMLEALRRDGSADEETLGMLARTVKDLALRTRDPARRAELLRQAFDEYAAAYRRTGGYWTGINAATLAIVRGDRAAGTALATEVESTCRTELAALEDAPVGPGDARYWLCATLGEAALIRGDAAAACDWYAQAAAGTGANHGQVASTRRNAQLLAEHLGLDWAPIGRALPLPRVVVFTGHMIDQPGRPTPRFPPALEPAVRAALGARLDALGPVIGFASAACGSDILFLEALVERGCETCAVLPYDREQFVRDSVDIIPGAQWAPRQAAVLARATRVLTVSPRKLAWGTLSYDYANQVLLGLAQIQAEQLGTALTPLAVWDGRSGDGPGGTASAVERWQQLGLACEWINLGALLGPRGPEPATAADVRPASPPATFDAQIKAMLFADVKGFSKLAEEHIPRFVEHLLGMVGGLVATSGDPPIVKNTWGDGLYFVFDGVAAAGRFALDLAERMERTDWRAVGLPAELSMRIGLHAGPVYHCIDPVTGLETYTGSHVSRAARIEPVTPPCQVYASQEFAALAAVAGVTDFTCEYVGRIAMAKDFGTFPTYHVRRAG